MEKSLFHHVLGQPQERDRLVRAWKDGYGWLYAMLSDDGRRVVVVASRGSSDFLYAIDLKDARSPDVRTPLVPILSGREAGQTPLGTAGTSSMSRRTSTLRERRDVAVDLSRRASARPRTVVPESADVIEGATVAGDRLAVHYLADVRSRLRLFTLSGEGAGEIPLPGIGSVGWALNGRRSAPELWYSFRSFLAPETVYRYDLTRGASTAFRAPEVAVRRLALRDAAGLRRVEGRNPRPDVSDREERPAARRPKPGLPDGLRRVRLEHDARFPARDPALARDGRHLRGGQSARRRRVRRGVAPGRQTRKKQNVFDDFIAAAEWLIAEKATPRRKLAIRAAPTAACWSARCVTQRPELFGAAVAGVGVLDMLRFHQFTVGCGLDPTSTARPRTRASSRRCRLLAAPQRQEGTLLSGHADHDGRPRRPRRADPRFKFAAALQRGPGLRPPDPAPRGARRRATGTRPLRKRSPSRPTCGHSSGPEWARSCRRSMKRGPDAVEIGEPGPSRARRAGAGSRARSPAGESRRTSGVGESAILGDPRATPSSWRGFRPASSSVSSNGSP